MPDALPQPDPASLTGRYARQVVYRNIGADGQRRLAEGRVVLIGCGALGSMLANILVRAGVGFLRIVDRDVVELNNLQRQVLFDEQDVAEGLPKAEAAKRKLSRINSDVALEAQVADANCSTIERLVEKAYLLLDGTDNFETRYLVNDVAVKCGIPWVYAGVVEDYGSVMPILPGTTPCLRCMFAEPPAPGEAETCETVGVLGSAAAVVASLAATEAMKILTGKTDALNRRLTNIDVWAGRLDSIDAGPSRRATDCPCCGRREFEFLTGRSTSAAVLCGQGAIQIAPTPGGTLDLEVLERRIAQIAATPPIRNQFMLKFTVDRHELVVFPDGRTIVKGTHSLDEARCLYARYVGL
jgi:molybdopterin/thiamine biosynthesis adenylyltransferase